MSVVCNRWEGLERGWFLTLPLVKIKNSNSKAVVVNPPLPRAVERCLCAPNLTASQCHPGYAHTRARTNRNSWTRELDSFLQPVVDQTSEILFTRGDIRGRSRIKNWVPLPQPTSCYWPKYKEILDDWMLKIGQNVTAWNPRAIFAITILFNNVGLILSVIRKEILEIFGCRLIPIIFQLQISIYVSTLFFLNLNTRRP